MTDSLEEAPVWGGRLAVSRRQVLAAAFGVVAAVALTVALHVLSPDGSGAGTGFLWFTAVLATLGIPARLRVEPSGVRIVSWLGFTMRTIARSTILSAEVMPVESLPVDLAERDRYIRGDGPVLLLRLENGATIALSALAPEHARSAIETTSRELAPAVQPSRFLPRTAVDDGEYRR